MVAEGLLSRLLKPLQAFSRRKEGATALEFALVGPPFFLLLMALAEVAVMSVVQSNLNFAMSETARRIRTGEIQSAGLSAADVKAEVCRGMSRIMPVDCRNDLFVDVRKFSQFADVAGNDPGGDGVLDPGEFAYDPGVASDIVLARGFYRWQVFTPFFAGVFANLPGGDRLMTSAIMFRNEPWPAPVT
jgi:Flp pilus assembly protein TadG